MRILDAGISGEAFGEGGDLLVANQRAIEARSAAFGHQIGDRVEDGIIFTAVIRAVVALDVNRLRAIFQHDSALGILRRLGGGQFVRLGMRGQASEIFLEDRHGLGGLDVTGDGNHHVGGNVVFVEELLRVGGGEGIEIRHPSDGGAVVGMSGE